MSYTTYGKWRDDLSNPSADPPIRLQDQQRRLEHLVRLQRRSMRLLWAMMAIQVAQVVMWAVRIIGT